MKCGISVQSLGSPWRYDCVAGEGRCLVGLVRCLGGLARRVDATFPLVTSGSGDSGLPQSRVPIRTPQNPLLQEPSTAADKVPCESMIYLVRRLLVYLTYLNKGLRASTLASSISHPRPYPGQTTIIYSSK